MKKALDYLKTHPAHFFLLVALIWGGLMCFLKYKEVVSFDLQNLVQEIARLVFYFLIWGILLSFYDKSRDKKERKKSIELLHDEIEVFRGFFQRDSIDRSVNAIRLLNRYGETNIDLHLCYFEEADFRWIMLQGANLEGANLQKVNFSQANLMGANLRETILVDANLQGTNLQGANLDEAKLMRSTFEGANLQGASLIRANLGNTNLEKADLQRANLEGANLEGAYLSRARLTGANLKGADLSAILNGANLNGANLDEAVLYGASLEGAYLKGASLQRAKVSHNWFDRLEGWNVRGREEIMEKYIIDHVGTLHLK